MISNSSWRVLWQALLVALAIEPYAALAQTEPITSQPVGMDTQLVFPHTSLPGATGIDFSFITAISPTYPIPESHTIVIVFEWGPTATGPWTASPDNVNTVPAAMTDFFSTGIFHGPADAPFVALHMYAGAIMIVTGEFSHTSVVPEPSCAGLMLCGVVSILGLRRSKLWG